MANPWTKTEDKELLSMYRSGTTRDEIAKAIGRPRSSIRSRLVILGEIPYGVRQSKEPKSSDVQGKTLRKCLCCSVTFLSDGPHNRLCGRCRTKDTSPYAH